MASRTGSKKPRPQLLRVLTLEGSCFQAITTLLVLDKLLDLVAERKGLKPKPCQLFDMIAGIGSGGWLALFLGRFQMDIQTCIHEWLLMMKVLGPLENISGGVRGILTPRSILDVDKLIEHITELSERYCNDTYLLKENGPATFVAAEVSGSIGNHPAFAASGIQRGNALNHRYCMFRTYRHNDLRTMLHEATNPATFRISDAFCVTNSTRYLTTNWVEGIGGTTVKFLNRLASHSQDIMKLAVDEMRKYYGPDSALEVFLHIGSGTPSPWDVANIKERSANRFPLSRTESPRRAPDRSNSLPTPSRRDSVKTFRPRLVSRSLTSRDSSATPAFGSSSISRTKTSVSNPNLGASSTSLRALKASLDASNTDMGVSAERNSGLAHPASVPKMLGQGNVMKEQFRNLRYPEIEPEVFQFGPEQALEGTLLDEVSDLERVDTYARDYLDQPYVTKKLERLSVLLAAW